MGYAVSITNARTGETLRWASTPGNTGEATAELLARTLMLTQ
jgi:hypothetical protein